MLSATGRPVSVSDRLELESAVDGTAYNLTVDGVHTYFVLVGDEFVLVHNECELGVFVPSPKHHPNSPPPGVGVGPANGQAALEVSVQVKPTAPRRVAYEADSGEFVVLDQTQAGQWHGHVRTWEELTPEMQRALIDQGVVDRKGKPIT